MAALAQANDPQRLQDVAHHDAEVLDILGELSACEVAKPVAESVPAKEADQAMPEL